MRPRRRPAGEIAQAPAPAEPSIWPAFKNDYRAFSVTAYPADACLRFRGNVVHFAAEHVRAFNLNQRPSRVVYPLVNHGAPAPVRYRNHLSCHNTDARPSHRLSYMSCAKLDGQLPPTGPRDTASINALVAYFTSIGPDPQEARKGLTDLLRHAYWRR